MKELSDLDICNQTIQLKSDIESNFLKLGEHLKKIRDGGMYNSQWESFEEYLWELDMSDTTASKLINIYEKFIVGFKFSPTELASPKGWSSLAEALPLVHSKEDADHYLHLRNTLRAKDYRDTIRALKKGTDVESCSHANFFLMKVCRDCGFKCQQFNEEGK